MYLQVVDVQQKLEGKKKDIEKLQEKEKALHGTFVTSLGETKFLDYLTKVFKKKIKRSKKKVTEGEGRLCVYVAALLVHCAPMMILAPN